MVAPLGVALCTCGGRVERDTNDSTTTNLPALSELVPTLKKAICDGAVHCCDRAGWQRHPDCEGNVALSWQPIVDHAREIGAAYDAAQAARCVSQIKREWSKCSSRKVESSASDDLCALVFEAPAPRKQPGETCFSAMDCQQGDTMRVYCLKFNGSEFGTCTQHTQGAEGAECGGIHGSIDAECAAPFLCGADKRCHPRLNERESCGALKTDECAAGLACDPNDPEAAFVCRHATPVGSPCSTDVECDDWRCINGVCRVVPDLPLALYCETPESGSSQSSL